VFDQLPFDRAQIGDQQLTSNSLSATTSIMAGTGRALLTDWVTPRRSDG
jgi:hypothetical protein